MPEFDGADLGDERRSKRLLRVAASISANPGTSLRGSAQSDAELEGPYRFINNAEVEADDVFGPHQRQTVYRSEQSGEVLVIHDTTQLTFSGSSPRKGLGRLQADRDGQGCLLHVRLALADDRVRTPLGVLHFETVTRTEPQPSARRRYMQLNDDPCHEGRRWGEGVLQCQAALGTAPCIHVMDREGDSFELMASLVAHG
ncbi:MAG: hypothetical protein RL385_4354 [Pseudomonadota bacterium]|jgi:hypothetical protein